MTEELLRRYIDGEVSDEERDEVVTWIEQHPENLDRFSRMKAERIFSTLPYDLAAPRKETRLMRLRPIIMRAAALLFLPALLLSVLLYRERLLTHEQRDEAARIIAHYTETYVDYDINPGVKGTVTLPDGSLVHLNSDSHLRCPREFKSDRREVEFSGEALFEVKTDPSCPMYIHTSQQVTAVVTGTQFNLTSYKNDADFKLTLIKGKVMLLNERTDERITVNPNEQVIISKLPVITPNTRKANIEYDTAWTKGVLAFDDTPMDEVLRRLERWYGIHIEVNDSRILQYHLSASFDSESVSQVLELLHTTTNISYTLNGDQVRLTL